MMGDGVNLYGQAANYRGEAMSARMNATLARRQAYAEAYKLEDDSEQALHIAGDQMMTMRRNQAEQVGAQRAAAGMSGFSASSGSYEVAEMSVAEVLEMAIDNAARSAAVSDVSAREQAAASRRYGDTTYNIGMVQAGYQDKMAKLAQKSAPIMMLGGGLTSIGGSMVSHGGGWAKGWNYLFGTNTQGGN